MRFIIILLLHVIIISPGVSYAETIYESTVTRISDGDTFSVLFQGKPLKIRIYGIDCPEMGQQFGEEAKNVAERALGLNQAVKWEYLYTDPFKRAVAIVYLSDGMTLQEILINAGLAWVDGRYCDRPICGTWRYLESQAQENREGLWSRSDSIPPWEWRNYKRRQGN